MRDEPLGLPKGSVRALISMGIIAAAVAGMFVGSAEAVKYLAPLASMVIGYYFGNRSDFNVGGSRGGTTD